MADAKKKSEEKAAPLYHVLAKSGHYSGVHPTKLRFNQGLATTTSAVQAQAARDAGLAVFDVSDAEQAEAAKKFVADRAGA